MTPVELVISFFLFTLAAVGAAGYVFVLRSARAETAAEIPAQIALDQHEHARAQAAVVDLFRLIGEAMPGGPAAAANARKQLVLAGYRWPSAVSTFLGIKIAPRRSCSGIAGHVGCGDLRMRDCRRLFCRRSAGWDSAICCRIACWIG